MAKYPYPAKCDCCEPPVPCDCDPELAGASITLSGGDISGGSYSFDVAKPVGATWVAFDVTIPLETKIDMHREGQASKRVDTYFNGGGYYGVYLGESSCTYWEWDQTLYLERSLRVFGRVSFPVEPSCNASVNYTAMLKHDGVWNSKEYSYSSPSQPHSDRIDTQVICSVFPFPSLNDLHHAEQFTACDWSLTPAPLDGCGTIDPGMGPIPEPQLLNLAYYQGSGQFRWDECPEIEDSKSAIVHIRENWGAGYAGLIIGLFVFCNHFPLNVAGNTIEFCIVDDPYVSDNSFDLTIEAEFYA